MSKQATARNLALAMLIAPLAVILLATGANAQPSTDTENGRYALSQTADGSFLRLDTRTGAVSNCRHDSAGWACHTVPDERAAFDAEIGRLQSDNTRLKDELRKRGLAETGKPGAQKGDRFELQLPDDQDIDRVVSFLERAWRRLVEAANRMQHDGAGGI